MGFSKALTQILTAEWNFSTMTSQCWSRTSQRTCEHPWKIMGQEVNTHYIKSALLLSEVKIVAVPQRERTSLLHL